ncbi:MAG: type IX secretion system protein PorQ [Bacteroidales bacterium]|nr:type IX secretion system protein PorQ [Bacteroidales bacterium]MDD4603091.1 type IX secretion system protein PorQ [Bacteroidales bacterium]
MPNTTRFCLVFALLLTIGQGWAQIGNFNTYKFLDLSNSARVAALGGNSLAVSDNDITLTQANPSLITPEMNNNLAVSYVNIPGGVNYGFVMYGADFKKAGSFVGSLQYINYGKFDGRDAAENQIGEFSASEYALNIGWGRRLSPLFSIGANGKLIYSQLDTYHSLGIAVDVAGTFITKDQLFTASLIGKNIGTQIVPYVAGNREALPFELQIGLSEKFKHIPLRFTQLLTNLNRWDLTYLDISDPANQPDPYTGEVKEKTGIAKFSDNMMRHVVLGAELTIAKVLAVRLGYNYQRRQELKLNGKAGLAGFSVGVGLHVKMFDLSYTRATYQAGSSRNYITLAVSLKEFIKKQ